MKEAVNINGLRIWIDETGQPCCTPGSREDALPRVKEYMERADQWVAAFEVQQEARRKTILTPKQERRIQKLMRLLRCDRDQAIAADRELRDL